MVAGSRRLEDPMPDDEMSELTPPEPTFTVRASEELKSEATGGCSGRGRLALRSSIMSCLEAIVEGLCLLRGVSEVVVGWGCCVVGVEVWMEST